MRHWLLTWTFYGNWLPGAAAGFVSKIRDDSGNYIIHNIPGTPYDANMPALEAYSRAIMKGPPVHLGKLEADALIAQYQETARVRGWELQAASVMYNHTHIVVTVTGDPDPDHVLDLFKSWATRAVKKLRPLPPNGKFWTENGSTHKLPDDEALEAGVIYVACKQPNPLVVWHAPKWQKSIDEYRHALEASRTEASRTP